MLLLKASFGSAGREKEERREKGDGEQIKCKVMKLRRRVDGEGGGGCVLLDCAHPAVRWMRRG